MNDQDANIESFCRSGELARPIKRIDTHAAIVLLSGPRALKIKRAVVYPFLDYSTIERRRAACEAELEINRLFAPELYKRALPLRRTIDGGVSSVGRGEIVEYAIEMRRFDETLTLDKICEQGEISETLARALAATIFRAHQRAAKLDKNVWPESLRFFILGNGTELLGEPNLFPSDRVRSITQRSLDYYERVYELLRRRANAGFVRRCHGDLHLSNVVLLDQKPVLFDAIEFDPTVASTDLLYDLAFLLMDLLHCRQKPAANMLLNEYLALSMDDSDLEALRALPLFMSVRAAIRAKVTAARSRFLAPAEQALEEQKAGAYFELADRLLNEPRGSLIAIGGLSGTGKSASARLLAPSALPEPGAILLRSDLERKRLFNVSPIRKLPGEAYSKDMSRIVYSNLAAKAAKVVDAGYAALVDAVFASELEREQIAKVAASRGVSFTGLFLKADLKTRLSRIRSRSGDASDATEEVAREQTAYDLGHIWWPQIDAGGDLQATVREAKRAYLRSKDPAF